MSIYTINGQNFKNMVIGGASALSTNVKTVNDLNVFPVPDGDTGYNMLKTVEGGLNKIKDDNSIDINEVADSFASGTLYGARGNSGVILSQFFKGFASGFTGKTEASVSDIKNALSLAIDKAYSAVETAVEGTILTVFRLSGEYANETVTEDAGVDGYFSVLLEKASHVLAETKEMLPVLKEANVVDSGGAGFVYILEGFVKALTGESVHYNVDSLASSSSSVDYSLFTRDSEMTYGYCTEFILRLQSKKVDVESFDENVIIDYLKSVGGDSIVAVKTDDAVKVHVHTFTPGIVLAEMQRYGEFLTLKIENMTLQHTETSKPKIKTAIVSVATGNGVIELFKSLGADAIVNGGQTANPSADDFIKAFDSVNAENIIVFPNNSNVLLTAKQVKDMYKNANVYVVNTKSIQHGYVALSLVNAQADDIEAEIENAHDFISDAVTIDVTYAVRDAVIGGKSVAKNEYMGISSGELLATGDNKVQVAINSILQVEDIFDKEIITVFVGADVSDNERALFEDEIIKNFPDHVVNIYNGGQDVYSYLICIE